MVIAMAEIQQFSKARLLDAALKVVRSKGYTAARIEDICAEAGVTKGSFFHHFKSKDDLALAAVAHWDATTGGVFAQAPYHALPDPLDRLLAYLDLRKELLAGELPDFTCFAGMIVQEAYETHPELAAACAASISRHASTLQADIETAIETCGIAEAWSAESLALHMQAVLQGAFVLAKAQGGAAVAADSIDHLRRYLTLLFRPGGSKPRTKTKGK
ncbi:MAG: Transcriptional regulator [Alphaproteobacteria bacterium]|jgi:TetR/AcrR family transcriptional repressor of nem operon|nr:Transcriptional regulator [Alphaproteobacteria bacterium]